MRARELQVPPNRLAVFEPPYETFREITLDWEPSTHPPAGLAVVWWLTDGIDQTSQFEWLCNRPYGLPLYVILPPPYQVAATLPLLHYLPSLDARGVLPYGRAASPEALRALLATPPTPIAAAVTEYLAQRRLLRSEQARLEIGRILELAPAVTSISRLAARMHMSRRTLGRHFVAEGLPVPSNWLQFARLLHSAVHLQQNGLTVARVAHRGGYPDGFTFSNQMKRVLGFRPSEIRLRLGWEWLVEAWIHRQAIAGGFECARYFTAIERYLAPSEGVTTAPEENASSD